MEASVPGCHRKPFSQPASGGVECDWALGSRVEFTEIQEVTEAAPLMQLVALHHSQGDRVGVGEMNAGA